MYVCSIVLVSEYDRVLYALMISFVIISSKPKNAVSQTHFERSVWTGTHCNCSTGCLAGCANLNTIMTIINNNTAHISRALTVCSVTTVYLSMNNYFHHWHSSKKSYVGKLQYKNKKPLCKGIRLKEVSS